MIPSDSVPLDSSARDEPGPQTAHRLFDLFVESMLSAKGTKFLDLRFLGLLFLIPGRTIIPAFAFRTKQGDDLSH